jgi:hypothetical protein
MPWIVRRVVPEELELMGDEGADGLRHLLEIVREIAQILHRFEQDGDAMAIHIATAGLHQGMFGRTQQKVRDEFLMGVRSFEARIVACHTHLPATMGSDFLETREPVLLASDWGSID